MRPAFLAGHWYPAAPDACRAAISRHSEGGPQRPGTFHGLIGPHAGWTFSGDCAGRGYRALAESCTSDVELVVIFGSHRGPNGPNTVFRDDAWATPLGPVSTARDLADEAARSLGLADEPAHPPRPDNAVELHLPFIRAFFEGARLLMIGVEASRTALDIGARVGELVRRSGRAAVFVGSTDLSHYGPNYAWSPHGRSPESVRWVREVNDRGFLDALLRDDPGAAVDHAVAEKSACCPGATVAAIEAVRAYAGAVSPTLIDHYLSYDVRPDESFVGYASLVV